VKPVIFAMPGNEELGARLASRVAAEEGRLEYRKFPDDESYLRFATPVEGRSVALACALHKPDGKTLPLLLAAAALKDLGACRVGLAAPYLAYMRQDARFKEGEAITSFAFARLLSSGFDWIATIDPHLHRHATMNEIYSVPVSVGHATPVLASYLSSLGSGLFLVGPDEESEQWVSELGSAAELPFVTMRKTRLGDRSVAITFSGLEQFHCRRPILVDDMISSGHTMEVAVRQLTELGFVQTICLAIHGILADGALQRLERAGATVITTNTIPRPTAVLDIYDLLAELVSRHL
jgi:ribose-phosphate pyrophosphokinase